MPTPTPNDIRALDIIRGIDKEYVWRHERMFIVTISDADLRTKVEQLLRHFHSQLAERIPIDMGFHASDILVGQTMLGAIREFITNSRGSGKSA